MSCRVVKLPIRAIGSGHPSRGDDALGPLCIERLAALISGSRYSSCLDGYVLDS